MQVIARATLRNHWEKPGRRDSEQPLKAWYEIARKAAWRSPGDVKQLYRNASFVGERVVFNIAGNKYRLVVWIDYGRQLILVKFVGTHREYDAIDVATIGRPEDRG